MAEAPFFTRKEGLLVPAPHAQGPWAADMMHGRLLAGLLAAAIEDEHGDPDFHVSRLTTDLFRSPPMAPVSIRTTPVREGNRIRVVDAVAAVDGVDVARASCVLLRRADDPGGTVWAPADWSVPHPDELPRPEPRSSGGWVVPWETRGITAGGFGAIEQKRTWMREVRELVAGEPLTPFVRVAVAADFTNPFANSGNQGLQFINADITLYLHRLPVDEWVGFEVADSRSADGVNVGHCTLYDTKGAIGHSIVCGVANTRRRP